MKKRLELDVDFIGGQDPLSIEEEKALRDFFRKRKLEATKRSAVRKQTPNIKKAKIKA
ncbi:MAG: hypothetical protein KA713_21725 [Chryseotalea sp. WA131a]|jgi:hypothetical protein|nr:MAG: hypothetical protein KA713_21725 [Chryseotalea sp. WA131a]